MRKYDNATALAYAIGKGEVDTEQIILSVLNNSSPLAIAAVIEAAEKCTITPMVYKGTSVADIFNRDFVPSRETPESSQEQAMRKTFIDYRR